MALIPPNFLDSVVSIGVNDDGGRKNWIGTGFLLGKLVKENVDGTGEYAIYLITNRHILKGASKFILRFNPKSDQATKDYNVTIDQNSSGFHSNGEIDVGIVSLDPNILQEEGMKFSYFKANSEILDSKSMKEKGVSEGDFLYVLGFPMGMIPHDRQYVILRQGVISRIQDLFDKKSSDFIIDATVFPGNSGGPVILKPEYMGITGTKIVQKAYLIGMVKEYIPYRDVCISKQTKNPRIVFEENSGLSVIEPIEHILQTIEEFEIRKGFIQTS